MLHSNLNDHSKLTAFGDSFDHIEDMSPKKVSTLTSRPVGSNQETLKAEYFNAKSPDIQMAKKFNMQPYEASQYPS
jgi:hypothetical protein